MANQKTDPVKEVKEMIDKIWPPTKKELEKIMENTKKMIDLGEKYLKDISEKSVEEAKKLQLTLQREKLYYELGKIVASVAKDKWDTNSKLNGALENIKEITKGLKKMK